MQARDPKHDQNLIPKTPDPSERRRRRRNPTTPTPVQYPSRIMSWGLTCIRAIAAAAKVANPRRRPPGAILSPVRPRSLAGALNAEAEGDDGGSAEGVGAPAPHRLAWGGVDFLEWSSRPNLYNGGWRRTAEQGTRAAHEFAMAPPHAGGRRQPKKGNFLASFIAFSASVSNLLISLFAEASFRPGCQSAASDRLASARERRMWWDQTSRLLILLLVWTGGWRANNQYRVLLLLIRDDFDFRWTGPSLKLLYNIIMSLSRK